MELDPVKASYKLFRCSGQVQGRFLLAAAQDRAGMSPSLTAPATASPHVCLLLPSLPAPRTGVVSNYTREAPRRARNQHTPPMLGPRWCSLVSGTSPSRLERA